MMSLVPDMECFLVYRAIRLVRSIEPSITQCEGRGHSVRPIIAVKHRASYSAPGAFCKASEQSRYHGELAPCTLETLDTLRSPARFRVRA